MYPSKWQFSLVDLRACPPPHRLPQTLCRALVEENNLFRQYLAAEENGTGLADEPISPQEMQVCRVRVV